MKIQKIELGDTVQDINTGFKGIAVVYSKFLNDCEQFEVTPKVDKNNKLSESIGIAIQSLKIIKRGKRGLQIDKNKGKYILKQKKFTGGLNRTSVKQRGY